jgi:hypothetical protein
MSNPCDICFTNKSEFILFPNPKGQILYCTCPFCKKKVGAEIYEGNITCPACGKCIAWKEE